MAEKEDFIRLFMPLQGDLMAYILAVGVPPADADDVLQNAALQIFARMNEFQPGSNFRAWAYAFVKNETLRHFKATHRRMLSLSEEASRAIENLAAGESEVPGVRTAALNACLERLRGFARGLLKMRYHDGLEVREIARRLGRPADSIYTTLCRIRRALQVCLDRSGRLAEEG